MFSIFSFFTAVIWLNLALLVVAVFSRQTAFLVKHSTALLLWLLWLVGLGVLRALLPLDFKFSYIIQSFQVMPALTACFIGVLLCVYKFIDRKLQTGCFLKRPSCDMQLGLVLI